MRAIHNRTATELAAMIRGGEIGCLELLELFLDRVDRYNPKLNAVIWTDTAKARARAIQADRTIAAGKPCGPLHGVPMTIKESYQWSGSPTTWGVPALRNNVTDATAVLVERLQSAGANIFGKTNVPIHLADWQSFNEIYGTTNNPWDVALTPGGSSGGSAAVLAAGLAGLEAGSDIGASIRNPAHYCGVFGHKPTYGIVPPRGQAMPGVIAPTDISVVGPLARGADDLLLALDVISGPDYIDDIGWSLNLPEPQQVSLSDFRIAVKLSDPCCEVEHEYAGILQDLVDKLAAAGATVKLIEPDIDTRRLNDLYIALLRSATSTRVSDAEFVQWLATAAAAEANDNSYVPATARANTMHHRDWLKLNNERHKFRFAFEQFFKEWDILLCPVAASAAWPHDQAGERQDRTILVNGTKQPTTNQLFWAGYSGVVYLPSTVGPAGFTSAGLPVGYQAIAGSYRDKTAIRFARLVEKEFVGFTPPPGFD